MEGPIDKCRNCKSDIPKRSSRCIYCGILNPTIKIPEILITIAVVLFSMYIYTTYFY